MTKKTKDDASPYLLTVSGSPYPETKTSRLLRACGNLTTLPVVASVSVATLPPFQPSAGGASAPDLIVRWRQEWVAAAAVVIATPAYLDNVPGVLKNALDWLAASGEASGKPVLPITFPPHAPRGEHTMQSLVWSLQALGANVVARLPLYQQATHFTDNGDIAEGETRELLSAALELLQAT